MTRLMENQYRHIHKALGGEMLKLEAQAADLDADSPEQLGAFAGHLGMIEGILNQHAHGEEAEAWPIIEGKFPGILQPYLLDHQHEHQLFADIHADLEALQQGTATDRRATGRRMYRNVVAVTSHLLNHMDKEEAHPYKMYVESLTPEQEMQDIATVLNGIPMEMLSRAAPWLASYLTDDEVAEDVGLYMQLVPEDRQRAFIGSLAQGMPPERWQAVLAMQPEAAKLA